MKNLIFFSALLFLLAVQISLGQIPQTISYQGILTDADGSAVPDGSYGLTFKLYDAATDGTILWSETQDVSVNSGIFNVILGNANPLNIPFDNPYWLGIAIGEGSELTPRIELTSSPYSLNANSVADSAVTGKKIAKGQVVRSINSLADDVTIQAGENVTVTPNGDTLTISATGSGADGTWTISGDDMYSAVIGNVGIGTTSPTAKLHIGGTSGVDGIKFPDGTLQTTASGGGGLTLPYSQSMEHSSALFSLTQTGSGGGLSVSIETAMNSSSALEAISEGTGITLYAENNGGTKHGHGGAAGKFKVAGENPNPALIVESSGEDGAIRATSTNIGPALVAISSAIGSGVYGSCSNVNAGVEAVNTGTGAALLANHTGSSGNIAEFSTNGAQKVTIKREGNVGIGTTNPQRQLHIAGSDYASLVLEDEGAGADHKKKFINADEGLLRLGKYSDSWTFTPQLTINNEGNVGIGTTSPTARLHIGGTPGVDGIKFPDGTLQTTAANGVVTDNDWTISGNNIYSAVSGNVGIGTTNPLAKLHILEGSSENESTLRVDNNNFDGAAGFFMNHFSSNTKPVLIVASAGEGGALVATNSHIGTAVSAINGYIGNALYASAKEGSAGVFYKNGVEPAQFAQPVIKATAEDASPVLVASQNGPSGIIAEFKSNDVSKVLINKDGDVGIGTTTPQGKLDVNGTIYQRGSLLHADYVFESGYQLESIEEHAGFMWKNKHLKAIPKAAVDENGCEIVEFGSQQRGIVEELEKAHIYIEQLQERIKALEAKIEELAAIK